MGQSKERAREHDLAGEGATGLDIKTGRKV
jgi:hypothetical protein